MRVSEGRKSAWMAGGSQYRFVVPGVMAHESASGDPEVNLCGHDYVESLPATH